MSTIEKERNKVQFGFFTAALNDQPIEEVAHWAAGAGFDALEIDVSRHIGDLSRAGGAIEAVRRAGLEVCALACSPSLMSADQAVRSRTRATLEATVEAALEHGVGIVVSFPGRDESLSEQENYRALAEYYAPLLERAAQGNVKIVIENWPGPRKDFLATTPAGWATLFAAVPAPNLGLNFDPSHLVWQGIDHEAALRAVAERVFLAHAKDTEIFAERLQQTGYFGSDWWTYRLPGHGRIDWRRWLALLREVGFDGVVSVEHEDDDWGWGAGDTVEQRQAGLVEALRVLRDADSGAGSRG